MEQSVAARARRGQSAAIAEMLVAGGMPSDEVYLIAGDTSDLMLALDGSDLRDCLGRPRRAWSGYPDQAYAGKTRVGREYTLFAQAFGIEQVIQVVVRPPDSALRVSELAAWHSKHSATLSEMLRYAKRTRAPTFQWDLVSAEIKNIGEGGWRLDAHFHLTTRGMEPEEIEAVRHYFEARGWSFWFTEADCRSAAMHPTALVQYQAKGLASALECLEDWRPEALAELRRQTRGLSLVRATGDFRKWKAGIARSRQVVAEDDRGRPILAQRRPVGARLRRRLQQTSSVVALRLCVHDFGDGLFRRSIRVRSDKQLTLTEVAAVYDLAGLISLSKESTAMPESPSDLERSGHPSAMIVPRPWVRFVKRSFTDDNTLCTLGSIQGG